jgi:hypothetical protein
MEIPAITCIHNMSVSICVLSEGQSTLPLADVVGDVVTERNAYMLHNGKLDRSYCDILLPLEEKEKLGIFDEVLFYKQALQRSFIQLD